LHHPLSFNLVARPGARGVRALITKEGGGMRSRYIVCFHVLLIVVCLAGCASHAVPYNPYTISAEQFHRNIHKVVVAPVAVPVELYEVCSNTVNLSIKPEIEAQLALRAITVVPAPEFEQMAKEAEEKEGGMFDPKSGQIDQLKCERVQSEICSAICSRYAADAVVVPSVIYHIAEVSQGIAEFCGAKQNVFSGGRQAVQWLLTGPQFGKVGVLCLQVEVMNTSGLCLYRNYGGIEALSSFPLGAPKDVPLAELFKNKQRNGTAVQLALGSIGVCPSKTEP
jgi:hypothetical protein